MVDARALDATFAAPLRGEGAPWPAGWDRGESLEAARRRLIYHGIAGLLQERTELLQEWPDAILATIRAESIAHAMWELRHKVLIAEVVEALNAAGIVSVLLKGTALAYSLYDNPALRFRGDSDLLIRPEDIQVARQLLSGLGWERPFGAPGLFGPMHYQEIWQYRDPAGMAHDIDLHWEVTNSMALRSVLDIEEVIATSVPLPGLSAHARCPNHVTALLHRAVNRTVHARSGYFSGGRNEYDADRLSWAVDINLLASRLGKADWDSLARYAIERGVAPVCADALGFTARALRTPIPGNVLKTLSRGTHDTPAMRFLEATSDRARNMADLRATPGFRARLTYVLARLVPPSAHVRAKYPAMQRWPVAFLHMRRIGEVLTGGQSQAADQQGRQV